MYINLLHRSFPDIGLLLCRSFVCLVCAARLKVAWDGIHIPTKGALDWKRFFPSRFT